MFKNRLLKMELQNTINNSYNIFKDYYNVNSSGLWEHGNYILLRNKSKLEIAKKHNISIDDLEVKIYEWKKTLMKARDKRIRPGLDDKSLTSWNALMLLSLIHI